MRKKWFLTSALSILLVTLTSVAATEWKAAADGLYCFNLKGCSGEAGCPSGGSVTGCEISCVNGGGVFCNVAMELD